MNANALNSVVEDYGHIIESLYLPNIDDRYVLSCSNSIKCCNHFVTFNLKNFPNEYLDKYHKTTVFVNVF